MCSGVSERPIRDLKGLRPLAAFLAPTYVDCATGYMIEIIVSQLLFHNMTYFEHTVSLSINSFAYFQGSHILSALLPFEQLRNLLIASGCGISDTIESFFKFYGVRFFLFRTYLIPT